MGTAATSPELGALLRGWRERRRRTQFDLALDAGISARHLSFVETGRSHPGRDMLLRLLAELDVPFREQNRLLLAAGHAPAFPERSLDDPELGPLRDAVDTILRSHDPYPAVALDRGWNVVAANESMTAALAHVEIAPELLEPPVNALRAGFHPRGMAPMILNLEDWRGYFLERLERQVAQTDDQELAALLDEVSAYPAPDGSPPGPVRRNAGEALGPLRMRDPWGGELAFLGMFAIFDTPFEVTASELALELLFPADAATAETLKSFTRDERGAR